MFHFFLLFFAVLPFALFSLVYSILVFFVFFHFIGTSGVAVGCRLVGLLAMMLVDCYFHHSFSSYSFIHFFSVTTSSNITAPQKKNVNIGNFSLSLLILEIFISMLQIVYLNTLFALKFVHSLINILYSSSVFNPFNFGIFLDIRSLS